jgi:hypothetical protein
MIQQKPLTKSKFKLGLECPNKLFFIDKKDYANQRQEDEFLLALAKGGFQVTYRFRMRRINPRVIKILRTRYPCYGYAV